MKFNFHQYSYFSDLSKSSLCLWRVVNYAPHGDICPATAYESTGYTAEIGPYRMQHDCDA